MEKTSTKFLREEIITPELAAKYLEKNEGNRAVSLNQVNLYAKAMLEGEWQDLATSNSFSFSQNGNLLDGQKRLLAIIKSNVSIHSFIFETSGIENALSGKFDLGQKRNDKTILGCSQFEIGVINRILSAIDRMGLWSISDKYDVLSALNSDRFISERIDFYKTKNLSPYIFFAVLMAYKNGVLTAFDTLEDARILTETSKTVTGGNLKQSIIQPYYIKHWTSLRNEDFNKNKDKSDPRKTIDYKDGQCAELEYFLILKGLEPKKFSKSSSRIDFYKTFKDTAKALANFETDREILRVFTKSKNKTGDDL